MTTIDRAYAYKRKYIDTVSLVNIANTTLDYVDKAIVVGVNIIPKFIITAPRYIRYKLRHWWWEVSSQSKDSEAAFYTKLYNDYVRRPYTESARPSTQTESIAL